MPGQYRPANQDSLKDGYTQLYERLVRDLQTDRLGSALLLFSSDLLVLLIYLMGAGLIFVAADFFSVLVGGLVMALFTLGSFSLLAWLYVAFTGKVEPAERVHEIAARLLIAQPAPYNQLRQGLNRTELAVLQRIARVEQSAAAWRGSYAALVVISAFVTLIAFGDDAWRWLEGALTRPDMSAGFTLSRMVQFALPNAVGLLAWLVFGFVVINLVSRLFYDLVRFLSAESANRSILLACEEARHILACLPAGSTNGMPLRNKRQVARLLGCRLLPGGEAADQSYRQALPVEGQWLLLIGYPANNWYSTVARRVLSGDSTKDTQIGAKAG